MTNEEWIEDNSGLPVDEVELAEIICRECSGELQEFAEDFIIARKILIQKLEDEGYEFG